MAPPIGQPTSIPRPAATRACPIRTICCLRHHALTIQLYAKRKAYPIRSVAVSVAHVEEAGKYQLKRTIKIEGELEQPVLDDLLRVANRCPVHKSLSAQISIETSLA